MTVRDTWTEVVDVANLTTLARRAHRGSAPEARTELTEVDVAWLSASPFCVVATASSSGDCDAWPKVDPAGNLVHVIYGPSYVENIYRTPGV